MPTTSPKKKAADKPAVKRIVKKKTVESDVDHAVVADHQEMTAAEAAKGGSFLSAIGRRKTSVARVRLIKNGKGTLTVNGRKMDDYFGTFDLREQIIAPLKIAGQEGAVDVSAQVEGGGIRGQAEAVRHGIARALVELNPTFRTALKKLGYLTRDSRKRERKKFGKKSARRSPQWSKR